MSNTDKFFFPQLAESEATEAADKEDQFYYLTQCCEAQMSQHTCKVLYILQCTTEMLELSLSSNHEHFYF